jgi:hypothetical protein
VCCVSFGNPDVQAQPLAYYLGELPRVIAGRGVDLTQPKFQERVAWATNANWKVMLEWSWRLSAAASLTRQRPSAPALRSLAEWPATV